MIGTKPNWKVEVKAGDVVELQTTYETKLASWYESMGINVMYMADADDATGRNPYRKRVDYPGVLNHGRLPENNDHGGELPTVGPNPVNLPDGLLSSGPISIGGYTYGAGDFRLPGALGRPPVVEKGEQFTFEMAPGDVAQEIWHSVTSCKSPCNRSTGISYPIADGDFQFDSGQMGTGGAPTVNRTTWSTPANLPVGTHTFFCRIHPLMRGAVRVVPQK
jgi:plastocyanin